MLLKKKIIQKQESPFYRIKKQELKQKLKAKEQFCEKIEQQKSTLVKHRKLFLKEQNQFDSLMQKLKPARVLVQKPSADFIDELCTKQKELIAASEEYENKIREALETCEKTSSSKVNKRKKENKTRVDTDAFKEMWDVAEQKFELAKSVYSTWISEQEASIVSLQSSNQKTLQLLESNLETCETFSQLVFKSDPSFKEDFEQNQAHYESRIVELKELSNNFQFLIKETLKKIDDIKQDFLTRISLTDDIDLRARLAQDFQTHINEAHNIFLNEKQSLLLRVRLSSHLELADVIETRAKDLNQKEISNLRQELIEKKQEAGQKERELKEEVRQKERELKKNNEHLEVVVQEKEDLKANFEDERKKAKLVKFKMLKQIEELRRQVARLSPKQHPAELRQQCIALCEQLPEGPMEDADERRFIKIKKFLNKNISLDTDQKCIKLLKLLGYVEDGVDGSHHYYVNEDLSADFESFCLAKHGADYHIEEKQRDVLKHAVAVMTHYKAIFLLP